MKWPSFRSPVWRVFCAPLMVTCLTLLHWAIIKFHAPLEVDVLVSGVIAGVFAFGAIRRPWYFLAIAMLIGVFLPPGWRIAHQLFRTCIMLGWAIGTIGGMVMRLSDMNIDRESQTDQRCWTVSLVAWGLISGLLFARSYRLWGPKEVEMMVTASGVFGAIVTLIFVSIPFRVFQNLSQPERRRTRIWESVRYIILFLALVYTLYALIASYPPDW
jgi:hypothetical protein